MAIEQKKIGVIVVDLQGDFTVLMNGALPIPGTDSDYIKSVAEATRVFHAAGFFIYATQDCHPHEHISFFTNHPGQPAFAQISLREKEQVLWPPHCVAGTKGAELLLDEALFRAVVKKGMNWQYDSYSGFQDDGGEKTALDSILKSEGIEKVIVYGLATDYCVKATALDAYLAGYKVVVLPMLCRGVALDTTQTALSELQARGIVVLQGFKPEEVIRA